MAADSALITLKGDGIPADARVDRFDAFEAVSVPYRVEIDFTTEDGSLHADALLRKSLALVVVDARGRQRIYHGVVDRSSFVRAVGTSLCFRVRLRPALTALSRREGCKIFQEKTIIQVIQTVFEEAGFGDDVEWQTTKEYSPHELIVQYRETHLNFVSRLFEEHGIFYFFSHTAEGHKMIVGDAPSVFAARDDAPGAVLTMSQALAVAAEPIERFSRTRSLRTSSVFLVDYDFEKPQMKPVSGLPAPDAAQAPYFEYPGRFTTAAHGSTIAEARVRELRGDCDVVCGASKSLVLGVGAPLLVDGAAEDALNGEFVVTELFTRGVQNRHGSGEVNVSCENDFRGIPKDAPFAAPRRARRPRIRGVQTALVTGSSEQEQSIHVDKYGRIKIRFYWDRVGQQDHTSSCWIRVSQVAAGGTMILPRVGWEVSVAFLEGDPDRPVVLGRVYNAEKPPPYALPATKKSGSIKSMSSPGGGGHNEIIMGDSGGTQGFGVHAQKDFNLTTKHDRTEEVGVDEEHNITVNQSGSVGVNDAMTVGGNQSVDVGAVLSQKVTGSQSTSVGGNDTSNATSNYVEKVTGDRTYSVGGNQMTLENGIRQTIDGNFGREVGAVQLTGCIASISENVAGNMADDVGAVRVHLVNGSHGETVGGTKSLTSLAAELHMTKADISLSCDASVTRMIGGLHYQKIDGDLSVKAPMITLIGAVGVFKGGSSDLKLGGGPIIIKGSKIAVKGAMIVKLGASLKMGAG